MHRSSRVSLCQLAGRATRAGALRMGLHPPLAGKACGAHAEGDEIMRGAPPRAARMGGAVSSPRPLDVGENVAVGKDRYFACFALPIWVKNAP
jgi:hypothetical protein